MCHNCIWYLVLELSGGLDCCMVCFTKAWEDHKVFQNSQEPTVGEVYFSQFRIWSLAHHAYTFCNQIRALKSERYPAPCDKKDCLECQTPSLLLTCKSLTVRLHSYLCKMLFQLKICERQLKYHAANVGSKLYPIVVCHWSYELLSLPPHVCGIKVSKKW